MKLSTTALATALLIATSSAYAADGDVTQTRTQDRIQQHLNTDFDLYTPDADSLQTLNQEQLRTRTQNRYMDGSHNDSATEQGAKNMEKNQFRAEHSVQASNAARSMNSYRSSNMTSTMTQQSTASRTMSGNGR